MRATAKSKSPRFSQLVDWLSWQESLHPRKVDLGLARVKRVFESLRPDYHQPLTITVGGTNGKGSCVALLESILRSQGYRVGAYTSPHILRYNERIRINGRPATDTDICDAFFRIDQCRLETTLSFFEFGTLTALDLFAEAKVDVQLLEVGLGGRLDAVNIIGCDVALITSIDIDHKGWLGETREAIGFEKAGIFRPGRPAVIGDFEPPQSLLNHGREIGAQLYRLGKDFTFNYVHGSDTWSWHGSRLALRDLPLPGLPGKQQIVNASSVLEVLGHFSQLFPVDDRSIREGLQKADLPGRYQLLPGRPEILLDVAHNPQAAGLLADHLRQNFPGRKIFVLFTVMDDKDIKGIISKMRDITHGWVLVPLDNARTASEPRLLEAFSSLDMPLPIAGCRDIEDAWNKIRSQAGPDDLIVIFGSFFLISAFLSGPGKPWNNN